MGHSYRLSCPPSSGGSEDLSLRAVLPLGASKQAQFYPKPKAGLSSPTFMALSRSTSELLLGEQWGTVGPAQLLQHIVQSPESSPLPDLWSHLRPWVCLKKSCKSLENVSCEALSAKPQAWLWLGQEQGRQPERRRKGTSSCAWGRGGRVDAAAALRLA